jgi:hypothetical protein
MRSNGRRRRRRFSSMFALQIRPFHRRSSFLSKLTMVGFVVRRVLAVAAVAVVVASAVLLSRKSYM